MSLNSADIKRIAHLARIEVNDAEADATLTKLTGILGLIEQMQAVDTTGIAPMSHSQDVTQRLRDDVVTETNQRELYQSIAAGNILTVPNPNLKPEEALSGEFSLERRDGDSRLRLSLFGELLIQLRQSFARGVISLLGQCDTLNFQLPNPPDDDVKFRGHRIDLNAQSTCRFVDEIDCLIRQEPVGYVAVRHHCRGHECRVVDAHTVVHFVALF